MTRFKKIAERHKKLRQELNTYDKACTQDMLAEKLKITKTQISDLENGKREPSMTELKKYAKFFDTPMEYLLGITNSRKKKFSNSFDFSDKAGILIKRSQKFNLKIDTVVNELLSTEEGYSLLSKLANYVYSEPAKILSTSKEDDQTIKILNEDNTTEIITLEDLENCKLINIQQLIIDFKKHRRELQMEDFID